MKKYGEHTIDRNLVVCRDSFFMAQDAFNAIFRLDDDGIAVVKIIYKFLTDESRNYKYSLDSKCRYVIMQTKEELSDEFDINIDSLFKGLKQLEALNLILIAENLIYISPKLYIADDGLVDNRILDKFGIKYTN